MHRLTFACLAALLFSTSALGGVRSSHDEDADFSKYETWAWAETAFGVSNEAGLGTTDKKRMVPRAIALELLEKGLTRVSADEADLLVHYEVSVRKVTSVNEDPLHRREADYNYSIGLKGDRWVKSQHEGTLIVDLIDREANRLVWKGWLRKQVDINRRSDQKVYAAVKNLFDRYPPKDTPKDTPKDK